MARKKFHFCSNFLTHASRRKCDKNERLFSSFLFFMLAIKWWVCVYVVRGLNADVICCAMYKHVSFRSYYEIEKNATRSRSIATQTRLQFFIAFFLQWPHFSSSSFLFYEYFCFMLLLLLRNEFLLQSLCYYCHYFISLFIAHMCAFF